MTRKIEMKTELKEDVLIALALRVAGECDNEIELMWFLHKVFSNLKLTPIQAMGVLELLKQDFAYDLREYEKSHTKVEVEK